MLSFGPLLHDTLGTRAVFFPEIAAHLALPRQQSVTHVHPPYTPKVLTKYSESLLQQHIIPHVNALYNKAPVTQWKLGTLKSGEIRGLKARCGSWGSAQAAGENPQICAEGRGRHGGRLSSTHPNVMLDV